MAEGVPRTAKWAAAGTCRSHRFGGSEHGYWCKALADCLRSADHEVAEEFPVGGSRTIDLVASRDGKRVAFEVNTGQMAALLPT